MSAMWSGVISDYQVKFTDGSEATVTTGMPDALRWERNNGGKSLADGVQSLTTMLTLIWYALRREQRCEHARFADFAESVADFAKVYPDGDEDDGGVGPTSPGQSDG